MSGCSDFSVSLDRLQQLGSALADVEHDLAGGRSGHAWSDLDPRTHFAHGVGQGRTDDIAASMYGLLEEAGPLGDAHLRVVDGLQEWLAAIHAMVATMVDRARRSHGAYSEADAATVTQAIRVAGDVGDRVAADSSTGSGGNAAAGFRLADGNSGVTG